MTTSKTEHLSAVLDDEAGEFEQRRILDELEKDAELQDTWARYALIGDAMKNQGNSSVTVGSDFLANIHDAIESEPAHDQVQIETEQEEKMPWRRAVGGMAAAATFLVVGSLAYQQFTVGEESSVAVTLVDAPAVVANSETNGSSAVKLVRMNASDARTDALLQKYVNQHVRNSSTKAIVPSIRAVSYTNN